MYRQDQTKDLPRYPQIAESLREISENIEEIRAKYRSSDDKVDIMAVTKTVEPDKINFAVECGIKLLGENRVQEYLSKKDSYDKSAQVQFIGHLQTNKVKYIINDVSMIQSVDSIRLAGEIDRLAKKNNRVMDILLEVNIGDELSKSGVSANELFALAEQACELENVRIKGLMAIPPIGSDEAVFAHMKELFEALKAKKLPNTDISVLSMGMSGDYELAVKHGSNLVRIGTRLFGARDYSKSK
ncbi:MAG: YggS family pyridoxal phosphate-dependent enzyme [Ruminococcus sp.]|nr:YggS family pyridoxal phosphate-dependent enzyme [Ruminococcus sp.]